MMAKKQTIITDSKPPAGTKPKPPVSARERQVMVAFLRAHNREQPGSLTRDHLSIRIAPSRKRIDRPQMASERARAAATTVPTRAARKPSVRKSGRSHRLRCRP